MSLKTPSKYRILIADHHPIIRRGLYNYFEEYPDFEIVGKSNDEKGIYTLLENVEANILISETRLPRTNIYRLFRNLIQNNPDIKILIYSSYTTPSLIQSLMKTGVHAYLSKSVSLSELKDSIIRIYNNEKFISSSVYEMEKVNLSDHISVNFHFDKLQDSKIELTDRELEIIVYLSQGYTNKEIASQLFLSKYTIETHRKNIMKKLNLKTSAQLIYFASQNGLI